MGLFQKFRDGLAKTKQSFASKIRSVFGAFRRLDEAALEQIEEAMIGADVGVETTMRILDRLRRSYKEGRLRTSEEAFDFLKTELKQSLRREDGDLRWAASGPTVLMMVGVNGTGKTTSIGKLAAYYKAQGRTILLAAADTFRAAAVDQLGIWAQRVQVDVVKHQPGGDPGAVCYDALEAAIARGIDLLIIDTAGRLQTRTNLMRELGKLERVVRKRLPGGPHEVLLVLDATTGQNALSQAKLFKEAVNLSGIFLSKLDGTAKGGIVVALHEQLGLPVKFIGVGEQPEDIAPFDPDSFVDALFEGT